MNEDLKLLAAGKGIHQWQIADELGIAEVTLSRWLRRKLSNEKRTIFIKAIEKLQKGEIKNEL